MRSGRIVHDAYIYLSGREGSYGSLRAYSEATSQVAFILNLSIPGTNPVNFDYRSYGRPLRCLVVGKV